MAKRPVFIPILEEIPGVITRDIEFIWHAGLSLQQQQKSIASLHGVILQSKIGLTAPLEISRRSRDELGIRLSAFNLGTRSTKSGGFVCVESLFQASKVFSNSGPFPELYLRPPREVREHIKSLNQGPLVGFDLHGIRWPLDPPQAFYSWVYFQALKKNRELADALQFHDCFTDIAFNPQKSINCQAFAAALYVSAKHSGILEEMMGSKEKFLKFFSTFKQISEPHGRINQCLKTTNQMVLNFE